MRVGHFVAEERWRVMRAILSLLPLVLSRSSHRATKSVRVAVGGPSFGVGRAATEEAEPAAAAAAAHGEAGIDAAAAAAARAGEALVDGPPPPGARLGARAMIAFLCASESVSQFSISSRHVSFCGTGQQATWYHEVIIRSPLSYDLPRRSVWFSIFWLHCEEAGRRRVRRIFYEGVRRAWWREGSAMCTAEPSRERIGAPFCTLIFRTWRARRRESYRLLPLLLEFSSESARLRAAGRRLL